MLNEALFISTQSEGVVPLEFILDMPVSYRKQQVEFWMAQKEKRDKELEDRKAEMDAKRKASTKNIGRKRRFRR